MAVSIGTLVGYLVLNDKLSPALKIAQANVSSTAKQLDKMGDSISKAGHGLLPISAGIAAAGTAAFIFGKNFEASLTQIRTLVGAGAEQVETYRASIMNMSKDVAKSPQELAEALYFITSSGQSGATALRTLEVSAKASAIGLGETKVVADAATSALNAYGAENLTAEEAVRVLVATVREGKGEADAIAGSIGRIIPIASEMGVKFQDLGAFMAATTRIGLSADEAATALRGALVTMSAPTREQTDAFADLSERGLLPLGFNLEDVRKTIREKGLAQGFMQLTEATKGNSEALTAIIGNVRAATGVLGAYGRQGEETLRIQGKMRQDLHEVDEGFKLVSETVDFKWKQALADMQGVAIHAFDAIKPSMVGFVDGAGSVAKGLDMLVSGFQKLPQPIQTSVVALLGLTALAGPALIGFGVIAKGVSVAFGGLTLALGWAATHGTAIIAVMTGIGVAAAFIGSAIAGWVIGSKIEELKLFGEEQMSVGESFTFGLLKIQQWTGFLNASDADIENAILAQRNLGTEVKTTATAFDAAGLAAISYGECTAAAATPTEQAKNMTAQWNAEMTALKASVAALTDEQRVAIQTGLAMEKNTADIALGLGITEGAVKAYAAAFQDAGIRVDEFLEKQKKSREEVTKLAAEFAAGAAAMSGTSIDARLAGIDEWFQNEVAAITGVGDQYKAHYAMLEGLRDQRKQAEMTNIEAMNDQSREFLQQRLETETNTYNDMKNSGLTFSREVLETQREKVRELTDAVRDYGHAFTAVGEEGAAAGAKMVTAFDHLSESVDETLRRVRGVKEAMDEIVTTDIQALTKSQRDAVNQQNAMTYELAGDPDAGLKKKLRQLEALEGTYAPKSADSYLDMIKDQVLLAQLRKMDLDSDALPQKVADRLLEATSPTGSLPTGTSSGLSIGSKVNNIVMNNYINGTGEQVARAVEDYIMRTLRSSRQFGSV